MQDLTFEFKHAKYFGILKEEKDDPTKFLRMDLCVNLFLL